MIKIFRSASYEQNHQYDCIFFLLLSQSLFLAGIPSLDLPATINEGATSGNPGRGGSFVRDP